MMRYKDYFKGFIFFWKGLQAANREMWVSVQVLLVLTLVLSIPLYFFEHAAQPDVYESLWDSIVWSFMGYLGNPGKFACGDPITIPGRFLWIVISIIKLALFAIPAGLVANGFRAAVAKDKRDKELEQFHNKIIKSFLLSESRNLKIWINKNLPVTAEAWYSAVKFKYISNNINLGKLQIKGMEVKDVLDVCKKYPEFRIKNEASAKSSEEGKTDRYVLEYFPVNRPYGFFIDRGSKVTIVSTSSSSELGTGNFSYYLAKFAGFNYISKDFNFDPDDGESFYNNSWNKTTVDDMTMEERLAAGEKLSKEMLARYTKKKALRDAFIEDLERLCKDADHWVFCVLSQIQSQQNNVDIHIAHSMAEGKDSLVHDKEKYQTLLENLTHTMQEQLQLSVEETSRFPLIKRNDKGFRNIGYKLRDDGCLCNCMTLRVSSHLMHFDSRVRVAQFLLAKTIHDVLTPEGRIPTDDIADMNRSGHGFSDREQKVRSTKIYKIE